MIRRFAILGTLLLSALAVSTPAFGQVTQVTVSGSGFSTNVAQNGSAALNAQGVGQSVTAIVSVQNGNTATAISGVTISGTSAITVTSSPFPLTVAANATTSFTVQYTPANGTSVSATVAINYTAGGSFNFTLTGTTPALSFSYAPSTGGNIALNSNGQITFPATNLGSSSSAVVTVANSGSASASISSVTPSGNGFQATSPGFTTLAPGQSTSFTVTFTPQASGSNTGSLTIGSNNTTYTFTLSGTGASPNFVVQYVFSDNNVQTLANGSTLTFPSVDVNRTSSANFAITNQGTGTGPVNSVTVTGSAFKLNGLPALPSQVGGGQNVTFSVVFSPTSAGSYTGTLQINLNGTLISATLSASTSASNLTVTYTDPTTNNVISLANNSTIQFPTTLTTATSTINLVIANTGSGTGTVNSIALVSSPSAFQLLGLPVIPATVGPSQAVGFSIKFSPQQQQVFANTLQISLNGQIISVSIQGQGTQAQYTYTWAQGSGTATPFAAGGTLTVPDTQVGQTTSLTITVTNNGMGDGVISSLGITGTGLALSGFPVPFTVKAGASQTFTLTFAPTTPGAISGTLTIGTDKVTVAANGVGSKLVYTYTSGSSSVPVLANGVVLFAPLAVGSTESLSFSIQNTGTSAAPISSISVSAGNSPFTVSQLPSLPMSLAANATVSFTITFAPNNTGTLTSTLLVNTDSFTISGNGNPPPALPSYTFQGPSGTQQPAKQPTLGLTLSAPYPLAVQGTLTLTFASSVFADDSSIQFASGGRTVAFTIPANSTQAQFNGGANTIAFQTGTTQGAITLTPAFALQGGFNLTPSTPDALTLSIASAAPTLLTANVAAETSNSFSVTVSGYSTTRVLKQLSIQFTPKSGQNLATTQLTVDVSSVSASWFQSTAAQGFGGSFLVAIPFTLSGGTASATDLVHMIQTVSITATNDVGTSNAITVTP
jgi:hypothetical protein